MRIIDEWLARARIANSNVTRNFDKSIVLFWIDPVTQDIGVGTDRTCGSKPSEKSLLCHCVANVMCPSYEQDAPDTYIDHFSVFVGPNIPAESISAREKKIPPVLGDDTMQRIALGILKEHVSQDLVMRSGGWTRLRKHIGIRRGYGHAEFSYQEFR